MHTSTPALAIILDTVVKSTVLLAFAWGAALALKKSSAATQHLVRTFALAALLLLPFSVMFLPAWHVKGVPPFFNPRPTVRQIAARPITTPSSLLAHEEPVTAISRGDASALSAPLRRQTSIRPRSASWHRRRLSTRRWMRPAQPQRYLHWRSAPPTDRWRTPRRTAS